HHHQPIAGVALLERTGVGNHLLREIALVLSLLDVRTVKPLHIPLIEHRGHRAYRFELVAHTIELSVLEHAGSACGRIAVLFEDVPAAEYDVVEIGQRHELVNLRRPSFSSLAETDRAHLCERSDRRRQSLPDGTHTGDCRRRHGAEADKQNAELAARRSDLNW